MPSEMVAFQCFQIAHAVRAMMELSPFYMMTGEADVASIHHAKKLIVPSMGWGSKSAP